VADITVYGAPWCPDCRRAKKFFAGHRVPYDWVDIDQDPAALAFVERLQGGGRTIPTVMFADGSYLLEPGDDQLAAKLGLRLEAQRRAYDLVIVGGGPAGLAAAIYAAREGIETLVIDKAGLGGQAGISERIDNYPGFPGGVGGADLADRFVAQAKRYGVELLPGVEVVSLRHEPDDAEVTVRLGTGQEVGAPAVLLATGSTYRRLGVPGEDDFIGAGVHFCATCDGPFYRGADELVVVGGANSALEEALFLTDFADNVRILARGGLSASKLLQDKVLHHPKIIVQRDTEVVSMSGHGGRLTEIEIAGPDGQRTVLRPAAVFVFIGLDPNTGWLGDTVALDRWRFIETDGEFATSMPGVFAAGDIRSGATKQLGSAVGEGIAALIAIRRFLRRNDEIRSVPAGD
jgi:thioredoxin reductase (NADPH)